MTIDPTPPRPEITDLLERWQQGDSGAGDDLAAAVYTELRAIAANRLPDGDVAVRLETTELVHEAFLRLQRQNRMRFKNRAHFFAIAARVTRRIVIDHMRSRLAAKRSAGSPYVSLSQIEGVESRTPANWIELDEALDKLGAVDPLAEKVVEQRFFAGMSVEEVAQALETSPSTVARRWRFARAFLKRRL